MAMPKRSESSIFAYPDDVRAEELRGLWWKLQVRAMQSTDEGPVDTWEGERLMLDGRAVLGLVSRDFESKIRHALRVEPLTYTFEGRRNRPRVRSVPLSEEAQVAVIESQLDMIAREISQSPHLVLPELRAMAAEGAEQAEAHANQVPEPVAGE